MFPIRDTNLPDKIPVGTICIIVLTVLVFVIQFFSNNLEILIRTFAIVPTSLDFSNISSLFPLITSIFLHGGFIHIISNMWFLGVFGNNVEATLGRLPFVLFYLFGGILAGLAQYIFMRSETIPILGASGAIAAILGFYLIRFPHHTIKTFIPLFSTGTTVDMPSQIVLGIWFVTQIFNGLASLAIHTTATLGVAWWAHIGGFTYGIIIGKISLAHSKKKI